MRILNQDLQVVPLRDLSIHPKNPKKGNIEKITESIDANGFYGACIVQKSTGYILVGNHRYMAAQKAGASEIPVIFVDVDEEKALKILLADNRTSDLGEYDNKLLFDLLKEVDDEHDLYGTAYDADDLAEVLATLDLGDFSTEDDGEMIEPTNEVIDQAVMEFPAHLGDVFIIGDKKHRIMCGDSTCEIDQGRLLDGANPAILVTDPPYGVNYDPSWRDEMLSQMPARSETVKNDHEASWASVWEITPAEIAYVWHDGIRAHVLAVDLIESGFVLRSHIIWYKNKLVFSRCHYHPKHETCFYAVRKNCSANWIGGSKETTAWELTTKAAEDTDMKAHSTQKPLEAMMRPIRNHLGDVHDPFLGSGTTLIAAERMNRRCFGMELDPKFVSLILLRADMEGLSINKE